MPLAVFKTTDQPAVVTGNYTAAGFCFVLAITAVLLAWLEKSKKGTAVVDDESFMSAEEVSHEISKGVENAEGEVVRIKTEEVHH